MRIGVEKGVSPRELHERNAQLFSKQGVMGSEFLLPENSSTQTGLYSHYRPRSQLAGDAASMKAALSNARNRGRDRNTRRAARYRFSRMSNSDMREQVGSRLASDKQADSDPGMRQDSCINIIRTCCRFEMRKRGVSYVHRTLRLGRIQILHYCRNITEIRCGINCEGKSVS